jgi:hypothetical protein
MVLCITISYIIDWLKKWKFIPVPLAQIPDYLQKWRSHYFTYSTFGLDYWGNELIKIDNAIAYNLSQELGSILWQKLYSQIYQPLHQQLWEGIGFKTFVYCAISKSKISPVSLLAVRVI